MDYEENAAPDGDKPEEVSYESEMAETSKAEASQEFSDNDYETEQWQADTEVDQWTESAGWAGEFSERQIEDTSSDSLREHLIDMDEDEESEEGEEEEGEVGGEA